MVLVIGVEGFVFLPDQQVALLLPPRDGVLHAAQDGFDCAHVVVAAAAAVAQGADAAPAVDAVVGHAVVGKVDGLERDGVQLARLVILCQCPALLYLSHKAGIFRLPLPGHLIPPVIHRSFHNQPLHEFFGVVWRQRAHGGFPLAHAVDIAAGDLLGDVIKGSRCAWRQGWVRAREVQLAKEHLQVRRQFVAGFTRGGVFCHAVPEGNVRREQELEEGDAGRLTSFEPRGAAWRAARQSGAGTGR